MAFVRQEEEDDKQQGQQALAPGNFGGGSGGIAPSGGSGFSSAPAQTPQQKAGSGGFTNLKNWLDAGVGRDKPISQTGSTALGAEQATFNTAAQPLRDATFTPMTPTDSDLSGVFGMTNGAKAPGKSSSTITSNTPSTDTSGGLDKLQGMLTQDYTGPMSVDYSFDNDNLRTVDNLSSTDTTGTELVKKAGGSPYSAGAKRLDNVLFGADINSQDAIKGNKESGTKFVTDASTEIGDLGAKATGFKDAAAKARGETRGALEKLQKSILEGIDSRVKQAEFTDSRNKVAAPTTGNQPGYRWSEFEEGTGANSGNMINETEESAISKLSKLIGGPAIARSGTYRPGEWKEEQDRSQVPDIESTRPVLSPQEINDAVTRNMRVQGALANSPLGPGIANLFLGGAAEQAVNGNNALELAGKFVQDPVTGQYWPAEWIASGKLVQNPNTGGYEQTGR